MNAIFTFELLLITVVVVGAVAASLYLVVNNRRKQHETGREVGSADIPVGAGPDGYEDVGRTEPREVRREFYKRMSLENDEDMKMRLYPLDEYKRDLGGDAEDSGAGRFIGAVKAYRPIEDEWYDFPPDRAADVLELAPEEYEVDRERGVLLLRKLPRGGLPPEARDVL